MRRTPRDSLQRPSTGPGSGGISITLLRHFLLSRQPYVWTGAKPYSPCARKYDPLFFALLIKQLFGSTTDDEPTERSS
jgi:hypothetical protein